MVDRYCCQTKTGKYYIRRVKWGASNTILCFDFHHFDSISDPELYDSCCKLKTIEIRCQRNPCLVSVRTEVASSSCPLPQAASHSLRGQARVVGRSEIRPLRHPSVVASVGFLMLFQLLGMWQYEPKEGRGLPDEFQHLGQGTKKSAFISRRTSSTSPPSGRVRCLKESVRLSPSI